ncbi:MAG: hypothetical protein IKD70_03315 [Eggerthellaceae bacterium]|nr:hypothetical protein [Eggerthellaceae bacterium]
MMGTKVEVVAVLGKRPYWLVEKTDGSTNVGYLEETPDEKAWEVIFRLDADATAHLRKALGAAEGRTLGARMDAVFGTCLEKRSLEDALQDWHIDYRLDIKPW